MSQYEFSSVQSKNADKSSEQNTIEENSYPQKVVSFVHGFLQVIENIFQYIKVVVKMGYDIFSKCMKKKDKGMLILLFVGTAMVLLCIRFFFKYLLCW